jgi:hypothetical protein
VLEPGSPLASRSPASPEATIVSDFRREDKEANVLRAHPHFDVERKEAPGGGILWARAGELTRAAKGAAVQSLAKQVAPLCLCLLLNWFGRKPF